MTNTDPRAHWDEFYTVKRTTSSGKPSGILERIVADLPTGRSLDLGSSNGDDVIWLAQQGWQAKGYDVSGVACDRAAARAADLGVNAVFEARDLTAGLPDGEYDLVTALFFQSQIDLDRGAILRDAAAHVAKGGMILIVTHAAPPPWSDVNPDDPHKFPVLADEVAMLSPVTDGWEQVEVRVNIRQGKGPDGVTGELKDNIVLLRRPR